MTSGTCQTIVVSVRLMQCVRSLGRRMNGLETLTKLHLIDMSHNLLRRIDPAVLGRLQQLVTLKLAMNEIEEMSEMPRLTELTVLHINDNKVRERDQVDTRCCVVECLRTVISTAQSTLFGSPRRYSE